VTIGLVWNTYDFVIGTQRDLDMIEKLLKQTEEWYQSLVEDHGRLPCSLGGTNAQEDQFVFILDGLELDHVEKHEFIRFVLNEEKSEYFQYGVLNGVFDEDSESILEELTLTAGNGKSAITSYWKVNRDEDGHPTLEFKTRSTTDNPCDYIPTSFLCKHAPTDPVKLEKYHALWATIRDKIYRKPAPAEPGASNLSYIDLLYQHRETIKNAFKGNDKGLHSLIALFDYDDVLRDIPAIQAHLENLTEEQVYYDLMLIKDVVNDLDAVSQEDTPRVIVGVMDRILERIHRVSPYQLDTIPFGALSAENNELSFFQEVFSRRFAYALYNAMRPDRISMSRAIDHQLSQIVKFPCNFWLSFKLKKQVEEFLAIDRQLLRLPSLPQLEEEHEWLATTIRQASIDIYNSGKFQAQGTSRYLYNLIKSNLADTEVYTANQEADKTALMGQKSSNTKIGLTMLVIFVLLAGVNTVDSLKTWLTVATASHDFNLQVKRVSNPDLISSVLPGDYVTKINDVVDPEYSQLGAIINDATERSVMLEIFRDGATKSIEVPLIFDGESQRIGLSFHYISDSRKLITLFILMAFVFSIVSLLSYVSAGLGLLESSFNYIFSLCYMGLIGMTVYNWLTVGFYFNLYTAIFLGFGLIVAKGLYTNIWIPKGWVNHD